MVLGPRSRIGFRENNSHPCAQRTLHPFCVVFHACMVAEQYIAPVLCRLPRLHGSGAGYPGNVVLIYSSGIAVLGYRVAMASAQEVEMLRRQLDELTW